jgi:hypothetical protein
MARATKMKKSILLMVWPLLAVLAALRYDPRLAPFASVQEL